MTIVPVMHPDLALVLNASGAQQLSDNTWTFGLDVRQTLDPLRAVIKTARPGAVLPQHNLVTRGGNILSNWKDQTVRVGTWEWHKLRLTDESVPHFRAILQQYGHQVSGYINWGTPWKDKHGFVAVSSNGKSMYLSAVTMDSDYIIEEMLKGGELEEDLVVPTNLRQPGKSPRSARPAQPLAAYQTAKVLKEKGAEVIVDDDAQPLFDMLENQISMYPAPGRPAEIAVHVGAAALGEIPFEDWKVLNEELVDHIGQTSALAEPYGVRSIAEVERAITKVSPQAPVYMHPKVEDLYRLVQAEPVDDPRLREYQREAVGRHLATKYGYVNALEPGMGKGHPVSTKVLTPTGWKRVGDLRVGDYVIGSDGKPTQVTGVFPRGELDVYRVSFQDGASVVVDDDHLWSVRRKAAWQVMETRELRKQLRNTTGDDLWRIPMTAPVHMEHPGPRPIPAYDLGALLGEHNKPNADKSALRELGLDGLRAEHKFVPDAYLYAPLEDRIALFQGLMDTDGYYSSKGKVLQFASSSERLADAVAFLVESFGGNARRTTKPESRYSYNGKALTGLPAHIVTIALPERIEPFRLERKARIYQPRKKYQPQRIIRSIEPEGREEVVCISVAAEDQLYLTEHCIVTHNTICALDAMNRRAREIPRYRGLIVVEANVRAQWAEEAATWAPDVDTIIGIYGAEDAGKLEEALKGRGSVIVITSYSMAGRVAQLLAAEQAEAEALAAEEELLGGEGASKKRKRQSDSAIALALAKARAAAPAATVTIEEDEEDGAPQATSFDTEMGIQGGLFDEGGNPTPVAIEGQAGVAKGDASVAELLDGTFWHDLVADEAAVLRNPGSSQTKALWRIRSRSEIAMALTGTPITRNGIDDLGRLISWVRNDPGMFVGAKLSKQFDVADDEGLKRFHEAVGVLVFRRNKSDIAEELPGIATEVVMLEPTPEELGLAAAARDELKKVYLELVALMELVEEGNPDDPRIAEAKEALRAARGAWLGGTQLARMAAADPASLINSDSAGAELLRGSGLIEAANRTKGTKRRWVIEHTTKRVAERKQVIIFTEFATVATGLIEDLKDAGVRVGGILGGGGKQRDKNVEDFRDGNLDVLVCTSAGKRGLNLQTAATVIHYDLPWTPDDVAQRTARVERIGATADEVEVLFVVAKGTIEERVVALLAARAATAVRALDISRGADGSSTDMGRILAGIITAVDGSHLDESQWSMLEVTRELVGA